ncbi:MAG: MBL fold metallo-hydrolase [Paludibacter sp.]|jgi:phosphoribosyl 1,2-cyclic phosphodiesterase|nr:MBL fold metallo-hydrolase [Paludibacter sp.]
MDELCFQSFGSGSSGNCYYIGNSRQGILIDAGISPRRIKQNLRQSGLDLCNILAVFVTHAHYDHIKFVSALGEKYNIPVYSTEIVHRSIEGNARSVPKLVQSKRLIEKGIKTPISDFMITAFEVSHDVAQCLGYTVEYQGKRFTVATDLGFIGNEVAEHIKNADFLVIEANYDHQMLREGKYPYELKERIDSNYGHLCNDQTGKFLAENYHKKLKNVFLCHLSNENNRPEIAYSTVKSYLEQKQIEVGVDIQLITLERFAPSQFYRF